MALSSEAPSEVIESIRFSFYSSDDVRKLSVKRITGSELLNSKGTPIPNGLYDPALGPLHETDSCKTCGLLAFKCPGHCGHIELVKPLYNPLLFTKLKALLKVTCFFCHRFRFKREKVEEYVAMLENIARGDVIKAKKIEAASLSRAFEKDDGVSEDIKERTAAASCKSETNYKDVKQKTWTALQYAEAISVLSMITKDPKKRCANCGQKNPNISSPTFGWLMKTIRDSDVSDNFLRASDVGLPSTKEDTREEPGSGSFSENDQLSAPANMSEEFRNLPPEFFKKLYSSSGQKHLFPSEAEFIIERLWRKEAKLCRAICDIQQISSNASVDSKPYRTFFLKALLVPPSKFRPPAFSVRGVVEHPQNILLAKVQESNIALQQSVTDDHDHPNTIRKWMDLQRSLNVLFDSSKGLAKNERETNGIRQLLEKKEGILRQKMMGKRVNFACRSVISPDPYLAVNEIGIPPYFALKLTYPERVTPWNVNKLRHAIVNGADIHPGASHYMDKDRAYKLQVARSMRNAIARKLPTSRGMTSQSGKGLEYEFESKVVSRHLQDGDIVLVNRQPTLHKPSMMAHVVRVLNGEKTLRMHYANCSTYNADFDGDEMNVHFPQDEISRAEAINIVNANKQYIVPTSGDPIRGLIQDHIVSAVLLSKQDTFLTGEQYHQLLYASCLPPLGSSVQPGRSSQKVSVLISDDEIQPFPPAIWKPKPLWTGKQVITAILCHITRGRTPFTIEKDGRIPKEYFAKNSKEYSMHICNNEFVHGIIDKAQFGKYGLVHIVHELYGADTAGSLLSIFSRLFTNFLQMHGFTCGVDDLLLLPEADMNREVLLKKSEAQSEDVHFRFTGTKCGDVDPLELRREIEKILRSNGESATTRLDRMMSNSLNVLTSEVNKALFPAGLQKPFPRNCLSLMTTTGAKGGLVNLTQISSLLGQQELEGKRVPRMVSGKTLPCFPPWDTSCRAGGFISDRFLTGLRPQEYYFHCMAGREGLVDTAIKTSRSGYLQRCLVKNLESLKVCYDYTVRDADGSVIQFAYGEDGVDVLKTSYLTEVEALSNNRRVVLESLSCQLEDAHLLKSNRFIRELPDSIREKATSFACQLPKRARGDHYHIKRKDLMKLMKLKYLSSLAEPGEPVGVIAAQSVGEPSTQMTLNTFHLAGRGEMNVTLGIPRLQEILMSAKEAIRTPIMTCPLLEGMAKEDGERIAAKLRRICVADIIESMEVSTVPFFIRDGKVSTLYKLKMKLYPQHLFPSHTEISLEDCRAILRTTFVEAMEDGITRHLELVSKISDIGVASGKEDDGGNEENGEVEENDAGGGDTGGGENNDDDEDDNNNEDHGADAEKRKKQSCDEMEYEDEEDKKPSKDVVEHDGEYRSGSESEVDQVEADEETEMGGDDPSTVADKETPEDDGTAAEKETPGNPSIIEPQPKSKGSTTNAETKKIRRRKKIDCAIFVEARGLKFEAHFVLSNTHHILLAEIAQKTAKRVYIKQSDNIDRCSVVEPKRSTDCIALQTAGVNFGIFWDLNDVLDVNKIVTNDIHKVLRTYGVEAARATIINEVKGVFDPYGIRVNIRHLNLIADFMCAHGGYRPLNRLGMAKFNSSPFSKMTFETATNVIVEAAFHGESDVLESPSASVCIGQPVKFGTGAFDLLQKI